MTTGQDEFDYSLSTALDEALTFEEYHRALLLHWRYRRQQLQAAIESPIDEASEVAEQAFRAAEVGDADQN